MVVRTKVLICMLITVLLSSCASLYTNKSHYSEIDYFIEIGDNQEALKKFLNSKDKIYTKKDQVLYYLEEGILYRNAQEYEKSNNSLTKAEYAIEELLTVSISKNILSGVLNDNALDYPGEDYEDIYINIFKSLNYLHLGSLEEALIEIRRANFKMDNLSTKYQKQLSDLNMSEGSEIPNYELDFHNNALARYIGILTYRIEGSYDDSRIERDYFENAYVTQPHIYNFEKPLSPSLNNDKTYINLLSFSGFAPEKVPETISIYGHGNYVNVNSNNNFVGFNSFGYSHSKNNIDLKLQFPRLLQQYDPVSYVEVVVDNYTYGYMDLIEDFDRVAIETFKLKQPLIVGKTIIRAISKSIISQASENAISKQYGRGYGILADIIGDVFMEVTENSDLRASRYFPSKIRGLEIEIEPGVHNISFIYYNYNNNEIYREDFMNYDVKYNQLNLIESKIMRK